MDDGSAIRLELRLDASDGSATFDFAGTSPEVYGNWNAPPAVTCAAVIYCLRCLVNQEIPLNEGCLAPVTLKIPEGASSCRAKTPRWLAGTCSPRRESRTCVWRR